MRMLVDSHLRLAVSTTLFITLLLSIASGSVATNATPSIISLPADAVIERGGAVDVSVLNDSPRGLGRPAGQHGVLTNALRQRGVRAPVTAAGPWRTPGELAPPEKVKSEKLGIMNGSELFTLNS